MGVIGKSLSFLCFISMRPQGLASSLRILRKKYEFTPENTERPDGPIRAKIVCSQERQDYSRAQRRPRAPSSSARRPNGAQVFRESAPAAEGRPRRRHRPTCRRTHLENLASRCVETATLDATPWRTGGGGAAGAAAAGLDGLALANGERAASPVGLHGGREAVPARPSFAAAVGLPTRSP